MTARLGDLRAARCDDYPVVRGANVWDDVRAGGYGEAKI